MRPTVWPIRAAGASLPSPLPARRRARGDANRNPRWRGRTEIVVRHEDEILEAVRTAREAGVPLRARGSGGSKNGNYETRGTRLNLDRYARLVSIDGNRVTVQAGMTVATLQAALRRVGLALPTVGEWAGATVAGATSTGTHGGSLVHGCFSTSIAAIRLVSGRGEVLTLDRRAADFPHAAVSLGALGVLSELTLECSPEFHLRIERRLLGCDRFLSGHDRWIRTHEFSSAVWFPAAGRVLVYEADRCPAPRRATPRRERYDAVSSLLCACSAWRYVPDAMAARALHHVAAGPSAEILSPIHRSGRHARFLRRMAPRIHEVEFAIPLEYGTTALTALDALLRLWPHALALPVGIRATAADGFSLSPCSGRDVLWISVFHRKCEPFTEALADVFATFDARCHWGKDIVMPATWLRGRYPQRAAFAAARAAFDPDDVFMNPFAEEYIR